MKLWPGSSRPEWKAAADDECHYCAATHAALARQCGIDPAELEDLAGEGIDRRR